jgi:hypothetical protein
MPARRTIRLGDDPYQFVPESQKIEGGNSDLPGACKKNAHRNFCPSDPERGSSRGPSERSLRHHGITGGYFPLPDRGSTTSAEVIIDLLFGKNQEEPLTNRHGLVALLAEERRGPETFKLAHRGTTSYRADVI